MLVWVAFGTVMLLVGGMCFARADTLADIVAPNRSPGDRAGVDRAVVTITGLRIIAGLLTLAGALLIAGSVAFA